MLQGSLTKLPSIPVTENVHSERKAKKKNFNYEIPNLEKPFAQFENGTHNVSFEFWHFPPIFVRLRFTSLATLFDCNY